MIFDHDQLVNFVGNLTIICTIGLFMTGSHICYG